MASLKEEALISLARLSSDLSCSLSFYFNVLLPVKTVETYDVHKMV